MKSATKADQRPAPSEGQQRCPIALYFIMTVVLNLAVLVMWPKVVNTAAVAEQCLAPCLVPIFWGAYLPFRCHKGSVAWAVSGTAIVGALLWTCMVVFGLLPVILKGRA